MSIIKFKYKLFNIRRFNGNVIIRKYICIKENVIDIIL